MDCEFKVPSTVPQDLLLIQDLIGSFLPPTVTAKHVPDPLGSSDDSIASTDSEVESEDEVEADLVPCGEELSTPAPDSASRSDSESDTSSSDSEDEHGHEAPRHRKHTDDVDDEESGVTAATTYLQTKNEIVDSNIIVPTISEVDPGDTLEKVGEIMSIIGNVVIVRGLPADHMKSLFERALDAESLLVFEDRTILGYIYETFGPTSQPLYQVQFNQHYPLDTDRVRLSREVFHVPQRSHFVFVDQLKKLRGSDASNINDEEPAEYEIEFSDDEQEAAVKAQRKKGRGRSMSSSRQSTPAPSRTHIDDMVQDTYRGSNPYDAHCPYDDDYHITGPSRPPPVPYDDPYAEPPTSDNRVHPMEFNPGVAGEPRGKGDGDGPKATRGRVSSRGTRGRGDRNRQMRNKSKGGYRTIPIASQRTLDSDADQSFPATSRMVEYATGCGQIANAITPHPLVEPASNAWLSPETHNIQNYPQPFVQPHINPRFASVFGLNLPPGSMIPWASQSAPHHASQPQHWVNTWTVHDGAGSEAEGDTYRPM